MTPALQPDAILVGIVDGIPRKAWPAICLVALGAFLITGAPWTGPVRTIFSYALIALASLALIQSVRTSPALERLFASRPVVYLGTISFGLYVFHLLGIVIGQRGLAAIIGSRMPSNVSETLVLGAIGLAATVGLSAISYRWLELPFLRLKDRRFSAVHGRPSGSEAGPAADSAPVPRSGSAGTG